jgi:hypothetical protein
MTMTPLPAPADGAFPLGSRVDDLLLRLRGLVLVRDLLIERAATPEEIDAHTQEAQRVRAQLAALIAEAA